MRKWMVLSLLIGLLGWGSLSAMGSGVGAVAGLIVDPTGTGLWLIGAMTELSVANVIDLRAQLGFATQDIEGLMLVTLSALPHVVVPPVDLFAGLGMGIALTPPTFSTGFVLEGTAGIRLVPADVVSIILQARYLLRWTSVELYYGPVFEGGILINF